MPYEFITVEKEGKTAVITINRPQALNALNAQVLTELQSALNDIENDANVGAVIITGAGEKAFVAGADIAYMKDMSPLEAKKFSLLGQAVLNKIETMPLPVIAAVNGFALGGGCELAMACDFRIASEDARFGQPEVGLGVIPGFAGTQRLPRLVGKGMAKQLIFTGEMIPAGRAKEIGLVNEVVPKNELLSRAKELANRITANGPIAVRLAKEAINQGLEMDLDRAGALEADLFAICFSTSDQREGMGAFVEKRKAQFSGK